jgi:hypothetical protein
MKPPIVLPPLFWLALAIASFVAAFVVWQGQRIERIRPPALAAPRPLAAPGAEPDGAPAAPAQAALPATPRAATPPDNAVQAVRQLEPTAGRQVLRCVNKGRVTYRDLNAGCPEGSSEKITVFPTEGVGKPQ